MDKVVPHLGWPFRLAPYGHKTWSPTSGGLVVWHPKDTKGGPSPQVAASPGTIRTQKVVPHLGSISDRSPIDFRSIPFRFLVDFLLILVDFPSILVDFRSIPVGFRSILDF